MISVDLTALVICALVFGLVFVLRNTFFEPLARAIETRQQKISSAANASADADRALENARTTVSAAVQSTRNDGYVLLDQARADAQQTTLGELDAHRQDAQRQLADARDELRNETARAVASLESESQTLAAQIAGRILGREIA